MSSNERQQADTKAPPRDLIKVAVIWSVLSIILTLITPAIVAYLSGVFDKNGVREHMDRNSHKCAPINVVKIRDFIDCDSTKRALELLRSYELRHGIIDQDIESISDQIRFPANKLAGEQLNSLLKLKEHLQREKETTKEPIAVLGFPDSPVMIWPGLYSCLGWMLFWSKWGSKQTIEPANMSAKDLFISVRELFRRKTLWLGFRIYLFYVWPHYLRNFFKFQAAQRTVYGFPNLDISPMSFLMQEIVTLGFALLIAKVWQSWLEEYQTVKDKLNKFESRSFFDPARSELLSDTFINWIVASVLLLSGFFFVSSFYWNLISRNGDSRYLMSNTLLQFLWGLSSIIISLPFFATWHDWNRQKLRAIEKLGAPQMTARSPSAKEDEHSDIKTQLKLIREASPINHLLLVFVNAGALISFLIPILQPIIRFVSAK